MFIVIWHTTVVSGAFNLMLTNVIIWKSCFILKLWFIRVCCFCNAPYQALPWSKLSLMNFKIFDRKFPEIHKEKWKWHMLLSYWIHSHSNRSKLCALNQGLGSLLSKEDWVWLPLQHSKFTYFILMVEIKSSNLLCSIPLIGLSEEKW